MKNNTADIRLNRLKKILLFALLNSSFFIAFGGSGFLRLFSAILMNISGLLLIYTFFKNYILFKVEKVSLYFKIIFSLLILWSIYTIFRSFSFDVNDLKSLFSHYLMGWAWLTPCAVVFGFNIFVWRNLYKYFTKILLIGSIIGTFSFSYINSFNSALLEFFAFLPIVMLVSFIQNKKSKRIIFFSLIIYALISIMISQRINAIYLLLLIVFSFFQFISKSNSKRFIKIFSILIISLISTFIISNIDFIYNKLTQNEEILVNNRSFLFEELTLDMNAQELLTGRGSLGTYYSPYFYYASKYLQEGDNENRVVCEVGYLQIILKGGVIMLLLYILILLPAAILGIFRSNNIVTKMCGYYILIYIICWSVSYYPVFSAEYILLWMSVGTILPKKNRNRKNTELIN